MSIRNTLIMFAICLIVGGFWYFHDYKGEPERREAKKNEERVLQDFSPDNIVKMVWQTANDPDSKRILEFRDGIWMVSDDEKNWFIAAQKACADVLETMRDLSRSSIIFEKPGEQDLVQYGLDKPKHTLQLITGEADAHKVFEINVGNMSPVGCEFYMRSNVNDAVLEVPGNFMEAFNGRVIDLRETTGLIFGAIKIEKMTIHQPQLPDITVDKVYKTADEIAASFDGAETYDHWEIKAPKQRRADNKAVSDYMWGIHKLKVERFLHPDEESKIGKPQVSWDITNATGRTVTVDLCNKVASTDGKTRYYMVRRDPHECMIVVLDGQESDLFPKQYVAFQDHRIMGIEQENIARIELTIPADSQNGTEAMAIDGSKKEDGWKVVQPEKALDDAKNRNNVMGELAYVLSDLKWVEELEEPSKISSDHPVVTVYGKDGEVIAHMCRGDKTPDGHGFYLDVEGCAQRYIVSRDPSEDWSKAYRDLLDGEDTSIKATAAKNAARKGETPQAQEKNSKSAHEREHNHEHEHEHNHSH